MHTRQTSKKAHKILISQNSIEVNHRLSQGRREGRGPPHPNRNAINKKNVIKSLFFHFWFLLASTRTTVHAYTTVITNNIDNQEARAPSIQFCQPIEMYNPSEIKGS